MESEYRQSFRSTSLVSINLTDIWTYMIFLLPCSEVLTVSTEGGLKRSGGQGDILSGTLSTFLAWAKIFKNGEATHAGAPEASTIESKRLLLLAAYGASTTTRLCSKQAFAKHGRALLADDLLPEVGPAYEQLFGANSNL